MNHDCIGSLGSIPNEPKICGSWADLKSEYTETTKSADFGQKSMDFGWVLGQNPQKQQNLNPWILAANPWLLGRF